MKRRDPDAGADALIATLADAAWRRADEALGEAWRDIQALEAALSSSAAQARVRNEAAIIGDALARAARARGLMRQGAVGDEIAFDPARHDCDGRAPKRGAAARIVVPGVARRVGEALEIVARARVAVIRKRTLSTGAATSASSTPKPRKAVSRAAKPARARTGKALPAGGAS